MKLYALFTVLTIAALSLSCGRGNRYACACHNYNKQADTLIAFGFPRNQHECDSIKQIFHQDTCTLKYAGRIDF